MAFPQVPANNGGFSNTDITNHVVNLPANISAGDCLLVFFASDGNPTITFPGGWTFEGLKLGSVVKVIDEDLAIDIQTRIVKIIWDLSEPLNTKIEVANVSKDVIESLGRDYRWRQKFY